MEKVSLRSASQFRSGRSSIQKAAAQPQPAAAQSPGRLRSKQPEANAKKPPSAVEWLVVIL